MPRHRPPKETWNVLHKIIWLRDKKKCTHCHAPVGINECHTDHVQSGKLADNKFKNMRTLCRKCHVLREDGRHRGMIAKALKDGIIPPNWRELVWKD